MKLVTTIFFLALLTSSFDLFLILNVAGANLRISQVLLIPIIIAACAKIIQSGRILWPRGGTAITIWCVLQAILLSQSTAMLPAVELYLLLMLSVFAVFAVLQLYGRSKWIGQLLKLYLISFVCISFFGLFQGVAPALHLGAPFVRQWYVYQKLPRINGFCYEPSFYATYLIMGWIMMIDLRVSRARILTGKTWYVLIWVVSASLFLSTSKTGWIAMAAEGFARLLPGARKIVEQQLRRLRVGDLRVPLPRPRILLRIATVAVLVAALLSTASRFVNLNVFISGTGIGDTAGQSVDTRYQQFQDTMQVFREHPWVGRSLGGVAARVAVLHGNPIQSTGELKAYWGFPVIVDILAASGIPGIIPFLWFFFEISLGERELLRAHASDERAKWLRALIRALFFEWLSLMADQNVVRMYLWYHVAILVAVAYNLRYSSVVAQPIEQTVLAPMTA